MILYTSPRREITLWYLPLQSEDEEIELIMIGDYSVTAWLKSPYTAEMELWTLVFDFKQRSLHVGEIVPSGRRTLLFLMIL